MVCTNMKAYQTIPLLMKIIPTCFELCTNYELASYGLKTVSNTLHVLLRMLLSFSHNNCVGKACMVRPHPGY